MILLEKRKLREGMENTRGFGKLVKLSSPLSKKLLVQSRELSDLANNRRFNYLAVGDLRGFISVGVELVEGGTYSDNTNYDEFRFTSEEGNQAINRAIDADVPTSNSVADIYVTPEVAKILKHPQVEYMFVGPSSGGKPRISICINKRGRSIELGDGDDTFKGASERFEQWLENSNSAPKIVYADGSGR